MHFIMGDYVSNFKEMLNLGYFYSLLTYTFRPGIVYIHFCAQLDTGEIHLKLLQKKHV